MTRVCSAFSMAAALVMFVACEAKQVLPPIGEGVSPEAGAQNQNSQVVSTTNSDGDFFGSAQSVPPMVLAFMAGKKAVLLQDGVQKLCINNPGPPCLGKVKLPSGAIEELGTKYVCRFSEEAGSMTVSVVDESDAAVLTSKLAMPSLTQIRSIPTEIGSGSTKISLVTPCSL